MDKHEMQRAKNDLLTEGTTTLWTEPTLEEIAQLTEEAGFDPSEIHLSGYESGGAQVFISNAAAASRGIEFNDEEE